MKRLAPAIDAAQAIKREVWRTQLRARKGMALVARRPPVQVATTPKDEVWSLGKARLWRYRNTEVRQGPPVVLMLGLVGDSAIFDLHPGNSWAERLVAEGFDVYLFDWGAPAAAEGDHTLETYLHGYLVPALDMVRRTAGVQDISLGAYCMGALMALLLLGSEPAASIRNLVLFTPPCDFEHSPAFLGGYRDGRIAPGLAIDETTGLVPAGVMRMMFRLLQPTSDLVQYVTLWEHLWREDYVESHRAVNHWAWNHRAMAGPAFLELIHDYVQGNALVQGTARLADRLVDLSSITMPTLMIVAERDEFVPPGHSAPLEHLIGADDLEVLRVPGGHAGALMGSIARRMTIPEVVDWLRRHSDRANTDPPTRSRDVDVP
jgi:polyhydroxyalkanoate synthase